LTITFNKTVNTIDYSREGVTVSTVDGESFEGDYVVVTVSMGVLKKDKIKLIPVLP